VWSLIWAGVPIFRQCNLPGQQQSSAEHKTQYATSKMGLSEAGQNKKSKKNIAPYKYMHGTIPFLLCHFHCRENPRACTAVFWIANAMPDRTNSQKRKKIESYEIFG